MRPMCRMRLTDRRLSMRTLFRGLAVWNGPPTFDVVASSRSTTYRRGGHPRGYVEPDESPVQAAERDLAEKLNRHRTPGRLLVVAGPPHPAEGDKLPFGKALVPCAGMAHDTSLDRGLSVVR